MHRPYADALTVTRESLDMLSAAIDGLPDEAFSWTPAPNTNSLTVLVRHSLSALTFFFECSVGNVTSITEYRAGDRSEAFAAQGGNAKELQAAITAAIPSYEAILERGTPEALEAMIEWPVEDPTLRRTGMEGLINIIGHLREHTGQAQLMRDLWLGAHPA